MTDKKANSVLFESLDKAEKEFQNNAQEKINERLQNYRENKSTFAVTNFRAVGGVVIAE